MKIFLKNEYIEQKNLISFIFLSQCEVALMMQLLNFSTSGYDKYLKKKIIDHIKVVKNIDYAS